MNAKEMRQFIRKFRISSDTIILVKQGCALADKMTMNAFENVVKEMGLKNVLIIVVENFDDVTVLNQLDMNRLGWYRLSAVRRLVSPREKGESS